MKRLGCAATMSRPFLRRRVQLTARVRCARVMPTYIRRRSSSMRAACAAAPASSSGRKGSSPSITPASTTCGHSRPLAACSVESVTTFGSCSRSFSVEISEMV